MFKSIGKGFRGVFGFKKEEEIPETITKKESPKTKSSFSAAPMKYASQDVKRLREEFKCSQGSFAKLLNISIKTVQSWESGRRVPSQAALRLLQMFDDGRVRNLILASKPKKEKSPSN